ncbi:B12-binding domain-containing radical SAM protein [Candidatus Pacearchaeota archaeon]|nr:B12-binding domain-containing radical SAM protein [Candidatus Pacearchaeota archaeon]
MKITFLSFHSEPIVLRYMSSYLKKNNHESEIIYLKEKLNPENVSAIIDFLKKSDSDLVGFEVYSDWSDEAKKLTKAIQKKTQIPVIWGGAHANTCSEESINIADMICIGEGEEALLELMDNLKNKRKIKKIKNIWIREGEKIIKNDIRPLVENLDKYPVPDYDAKDSYILRSRKLERLSKEKIEQIISAKYSILGSRGCVFSCTYCCNNQNRQRYCGKGVYFRRHSIKNIIDELKWAKKEFPKVRYIRIWDDLFMMRDIKELREFCKLYKKEIGLPFSCRLQFNIVTSEILDLLKDAGIRNIELGVESGSERIRKNIFKRNTSPEKILEVATKISKRKIDTVYNIIFNNPYENIEDIKEAIKFFTRFPRPLEIQGFNLVFLPGTDIYEMAKKDKFILPPDKNLKLSKEPLFRFSYDNQLDNFIYRINFESKHKKYYNILLSLTPFFPRGFLSYAADNKNLLTIGIVYGYVSLVRPIKVVFAKIFYIIKKHEKIKAPLSRVLTKFPKLIKIAQFRKWETMN